MSDVLSFIVYPLITGVFVLGGNWIMARKQNAVSETNLKNSIEHIKTVTEMTIEQVKNEVKGFKEVVREDIKRLEDKQDKYNNLKDRMLKVEMSTKSAHKRLDEECSKK